MGAAGSSSGSTNGGAGSSGASGGVTATSGGTGAVSGGGGADAGMGGAGAPAEECGEYVACGCGCCGGTEPSGASCYYPERGESLDDIVSADRAAASDPGCANAGCSLGTRRVCCQSSSADDGAGTYTGSGLIGGLDHLAVHRASPAGRCTTLGIATAASSERPFAVELPAGWRLETATDGACDVDGMVSEPIRFAFGGVGTLSFVDASCTLAVDATLFFLTDSGEVEAVRLVQEAVAVTGGVTCR
jgi:hypothetical protein